MIGEPAPSLNKVYDLLRRSQRLGLLSAIVMTVLPVLEWWGAGMTRTFGVYAALTVFMWSLQIRQAITLRQLRLQPPNEKL